MNWALIGLGFGFGTFKFLFAHWITYSAFGEKGFTTIAEIFVSTTGGAVFSMAIFYFLSDYLMDRAAEKREAKKSAALKAGKEYKIPARFTRLNKFIVRIKMAIGIYGVTLLAPLFLSIPLGSIICAKFYGHHKKTFPLMVMFMTIYSFLMCFIIYLIN